MRYIYQHTDWPNFYWDETKISSKLTDVRYQLGYLLGQVSRLSFDAQDLAGLEILTDSIVKSSAIEGENLDEQQVRSSLARHLGLEIAGLTTSERHVDGIVEVLLDATRHATQSLDEHRLCAWHAALFPNMLSGLQIINPGVWRRDTDGPMQVVSGSYGRQKVHFQAPPAAKLEPEIQQFLQWINLETHPHDLILSAAIAHLWFVTLHPFDDGNGRLARAIADMMLSRADQQTQRFYSMSSQIRLERKAYYQILEQTQKANLDITLWLHWFLDCLLRALKLAEQTLNHVLAKSKFWQTHQHTHFNPRQIMMLNHLFDGFKGKLTSSKWAKMTKCSQDSAHRDIKDLLAKNILFISDDRGRSTHYELRDYQINYLD